MYIHTHSNHTFLTAANPGPKVGLTKSRETIQPGSLLRTVAVLYLKGFRELHVQLLYNATQRQDAESKSERDNNDHITTNRAWQ